VSVNAILVRMLTALQSTLHCQSLIRHRANAFVISLDVQILDSQLLTSVHANANAIWSKNFAQIKLYLSSILKLVHVFAKKIKKIARV
jgi:hypothetical protein